VSEYLQAGRRTFGGAGAAGLLLLAAACAASGAQVGGGFWPAVGPGKVAVHGAGMKPATFVANLRYDFDGTAEALSGTGTIQAYDEIGLTLLAEFPFTWTTAGGAAFRFDVAGPELEDFLSSRISAATGKAADVTLETASGKGVLRKDATDLKATIQIAGECSLDGGESRRLRAKIKGR